MCRLASGSRPSGARLVTGGDREKAIVQPTVIADVKPGMKLATRTVWACNWGGTCKDFDEAMEIANGSKYGLGASIFTKMSTQPYASLNRLMGMP